MFFCCVLCRILYYVCGCQCDAVTSMAPKICLLLWALLSCHVPLLPCNHLGFRGGVSSLKLPKGRAVSRPSKGRGVSISHIQRNEDIASSSSYSSVSALSPKRLVGKLLDPGSLVFHVAPTLLTMTLARVTKHVDFSSADVSAIARGCTIAYLIMSQLLFWSLRRCINAAGDRSPVEHSPTIIDLLGALSGKRPPEKAQTVLEYDLGEVDRLQSGLVMETSLYMIMILLRYYHFCPCMSFISDVGFDRYHKQLLWYLMSNTLSLLRANVVLVNVFGMRDEVKYPSLRRPFKSSIQAVISTYTSGAFGPGRKSLSEMSAAYSPGLSVLDNSFQEGEVEMNGEGDDNELDALPDTPNNNMDLQSGEDELDFYEPGENSNSHDETSAADEQRPNPNEKSVGGAPYTYAPRALSERVANKLDAATAEFIRDAQIEVVND